MEGESGKQGSEGESKQSAEQSQPELAPIQATEPAQGENATDPPRDKPKKRCWRDKRWTHPQVIVNGALAFVAVIAAIIYFCQLQQMKKATRAATNATKAATDSVKFARDHAHLDQRAWIAVTVAPGSPPQLDTVWQTPMAVKNTGKTFARQIKIGFARRTLPKGQFPNFSEAAPTTKESETISLLAPNVEYTFDTNVKVLKKVDQEALNALNSGEWVVFVFGQVTYTDIFDCAHWTEFCFQFNPATGQFPSCENHNDADNNRCP
jgi:hypothetical protein